MLMPQATAKTAALSFRPGRAPRSSPELTKGSSRRRISRSRVPRDAGAPDRRHIAGCPVAGLYRLGFAFGGGAAAANGDRPGRIAERETVLRNRASLLLARSGAVVPDQAAAAGSTLCRAGVGKSAVQSARAGVSAERAMVAQRDHRRARRGAAERGDRRVLGAAGARYAGAVQFRRYQSRSAAEGLPERRREFRVRLAELVQRLDALAVRRQAGRRTRISSSAKPSRRRAARSCSATN